MANTAEYTPTTRLANEIRRELRNKLTNGYTTLAPSTDNDGVVTIKVKDAFTKKLLIVTITESES